MRFTLTARTRCDYACGVDMHRFERNESQIEVVCIGAVGQRRLPTPQEAEALREYEAQMLGAASNTMWMLGGQSAARAALRRLGQEVSA